MSQVNVNEETGLAPVFLRVPFEGNMGGDVAGFGPKLAQALVDRGYAEPYDAEIHEKPAKHKMVTLEARREEVAMNRRLAAQTAEFRPAELIHEDEAAIAARLGELEFERTERFVPSGLGSGTRAQIDERSPVAERAAPPVVERTDTGLTTANAPSAPTEDAETENALPSQTQNRAGGRPKGGAPSAPAES